MAATPRIRLPPETALTTGLCIVVAGLVLAPMFADAASSSHA